MKSTLAAMKPGNTRASLYLRRRRIGVRGAIHKNGYKIRGKCAREVAAVVTESIAAAHAIGHDAGHVELTDPRLVPFRAIKKY